MSEWAFRKRIGMSNVKLINGTELWHQESADNDFIVDDLVPIGLTLLGGAPKSGKTLLAMQLVHSLSLGKPFLGYNTEHTKTLYLALEDSQQSFKERYQQFNVELNENCLFRFGSTTMHELETILKCNPNIGCVVIDTFALFRTNKDIQYQQEYDEVKLIRDLALRYKCSIILIHHTKKSYNPKEPFNGFLGSSGLTAGVDTMIILERLSQKQRAILSVTGKNQPMVQIPLGLNENLIWSVTEREEDDEEVDPSVIIVMNYVYKVKQVKDTMQNLCSQLGLKLTPNQLSKRLSDHEEILKANGIEMKRMRSQSKRFICLTLIDESE